MGWSKNCLSLPLIPTIWFWVSCKAVSSTTFWVFGMNRSGIEPRSPGPLVNTLLTGPMALFYATIRKDSVSLLRFLFLSYFQIFSFAISFVCRLKCPYSCFSSYFCFLFFSVPLMCVLSVLFLIGGTHSSSVFFYVIFKSLYLYINALLNAGKSSFSFSKLKQYVCVVLEFSCSLVHLLKSFSDQL